jgi:hypothetical protein
MQREDHRTSFAAHEDQALPGGWACCNNFGQNNNGERVGNCAVIGGAQVNRRIEGHGADI